VRICGTATDGADAERLAEIRRRHIGFVFQSYHLFRTMTAAENVRLALDVRGEYGGKSRRRAHDLLAELGMGDKLKSFPRQLSGGEQQRVAIARAVVAGPQIVLADEPTAALDGATGQSIMEILARIARQQHRAVMVVTHDSRLLRFADRVVSIEDGRITPQIQPSSRIYQMRGG
jgi:putative ABC transport system ATP-binding protein